MDDCLLAFLGGFFTCAIGVFLALMFEIGMDWIGTIVNMKINHKE